MEELGIDLSEEQIKQLNDFKGFLTFQQTWPFKKFCYSRSKIVCMFTGNQFGKTSGTAHSYVQRCLGVFPVPEKNIVYWECEFISSKDEPIEEGCHRIEKIRNSYTGETKETLLRTTWNALTKPADDVCPHCMGKVVKHERKSRTFRFCAEVLPGQAGQAGENGESVEVKNTQYPAFKQWLPPFLIKKDITSRNTAMQVIDIYGGPDIIIDFVGYNQSIQSVAGTQRVSVWYDEEPPREFRNEQVPRLLQENGDEVFTVTPANHITWMYDELFENASIIYRTDAIVEFLKENDNTDTTKIEWLEGKNITVIMAATDDNPTLTKEAIQEMVDQFDDPDIIAIRRYGIFKQVSGKIFKDYDRRFHEINGEDYFPDGVPLDWTHARGIDFHPQTPWGVGFISLSPRNEAFVWFDMNPSPEKMTTMEISKEIALESRDYKFRLSLIDPLAEMIKKDNISSLDDILEEFHHLRMEGIGTGGYWQTWDTKGLHGRDEIRKRLKNAVQCEKPFNNKVNGKYLPTIWFFSDCRIMCKSMRQWRWEEYKDSGQLQTKGQKNKPEQRWSHHPMVLEAIFKNPAFRPPVVKKYHDDNRSKPKPKGYFNRRH